MAAHLVFNTCEWERMDGTMTIPELSERVAILRYAGVVPQEDGLFPMILTGEEYDELRVDKSYSWSEHTQTSPNKLMTYQALPGCGVALYVLGARSFNTEGGCILSDADIDVFMDSLPSEIAR